MRARSVFILLMMLASGAAAAPGARYELFPEQSVRRAGAQWVSSAYVLDKTANQFWVCTARYNSESGEANGGECSILPANVGRPSLNERFQSEAILGATAQGPFLPVFWFIEPARGEVQFCAPRHPGVCVKLDLPKK